MATRWVENWNWRVKDHSESPWIPISIFRRILIHSKTHKLHRTLISIPHEYPHTKSSYSCLLVNLIYSTVGRMMPTRKKKNRPCLAVLKYFIDSCLLEIYLVMYVILLQRKQFCCVFIIILLLIRIHAEKNHHTGQKDTSKKVSHRFAHTGDSEKSTKENNFNWFSK